MRWRTRGWQCDKQDECECANGIAGVGEEYFSQSSVNPGEGLSSLLDAPLSLNIAATSPESPGHEVTRIAGMARMARMAPTYPMALEGLGGLGGVGGLSESELSGKLIAQQANSEQVRRPRPPRPLRESPRTPTAVLPVEYSRLCSPTG